MVATQTKQQNGSIYQPLTVSPNVNKNNEPATPLAKAIKHEFFPEVTFCNLSTNDPDEHSSNGKILRNNITTIDGINTTTTITIGKAEELKKRKRLISNESGDSIDSSRSSNDKNPEIRRIPDGGYGWVVVFASLVVSLIADGISFSFGLINTELLAYFGESPSKTAWISSLFFSVPLILGPVMSNLVDKYGCRRMTIYGGLISAIGFALASFCNSIEMLMLTFGIISGVGLGIGYVTAVVSIAFWFDKKRSFATGIGASGTGIGTFLYAPLTQYLIDSYGWRGATLILAGTMLHTCVCGALMRDPDWLIEENRLESRSQSVTTFSNSSVCLEEIKKLLDTGITKEAVLDTLVTKNNTEANQQIDDPTELSLKRYRSEIFLPTFLGSFELDSIYEVKSLSRRSLRHKEGVEAPSRENLLSMSSTGAPATTQIVGSPMDDMDALLGGRGGEERTATTRYGGILKSNKKSYIASVETLSPAEKLESFNSINEENLHQQHLHHTHSNNRSDYANSRFSLNENLFTVERDIHIRPSPLRHNSVDILQDEIVCNHMLYKDDAFNLLEKNFQKRNHQQAAIITIPENPTTSAAASKAAAKRARTDSITGIRRLSKSKKPSNRSNLRRNISIRNSNFLKDVRLHRNSIHYRGAMLNTHRYRLRASSCPNIYRNSMTTIAKEEKDTWYEAFIDTMKTIFDVTLFRDVKFTLFNLSTLSLFIWFIIPYLYLPEYIKKYEYESAQLISAIGVAQTIGMILLGFLGDRSWMNVNVCYSACMLVCGASVFLMPLFLYSYYALLALCIIFGFTFASSFSFTPSILVSIVDLDDFTCAYGLVLLVQGLGMLAGPPLAGAIYELTFRWDDTFYIAGIFIAISGILSYFIEFCEKKETDGNDASEMKKVNLIH